MASTEIEKRDTHPVTPQPQRVIDVQLPSEPAPPAVRSEQALAIVTQGIALLSGVMRLALQLLNARQPSARRTTSSARSPSTPIVDALQRTQSRRRRHRHRSGRRS